MKVIFIVPPSTHYIEPYAYEVADQSNECRVYLGLLYLAAYVREKINLDIRVIDAAADKLSLDDIESIIRKEQPDIVGFSVLTFNLLNCLDVSRMIKKVSTKTKICYGGWHPTLYPKETLAFDSVDYIVTGEGEVTFTDLVSGEIDVHQINGLGFKQNGNSIINPPRDLIKDLDILPFPAYDLIDVKKYSNLLASEDLAITLATSRGCPFACTFCDIRRTKYRSRSAENIIKEITYWREKGVKEFFIQDDNFTSVRRRTLEVCDLLEKSGLDIKYKISSRVDSINEELMLKLKKTGCYRIYYGVESGSQRILDYLGKNTKTDQIEEAFRITKKHGIDAVAYIMIGVPGEKKDDIEKTLKLVKKIKPNHLHTSICTPMPQTSLYKNLLEDKTIKVDYWKDFAENPSPEFITPFAHETMGHVELRNLQNKIQKQFYFSPGIIIRELLKTRSLEKIISKAKLAFNIMAN